MDNFKTISTSSHSAKLAEPIVIEETGTTRKVLIVDLNDNKKAIGETVGITFVHQRKKHERRMGRCGTYPIKYIKRWRRNKTKS